MAGYSLRLMPLVTIRLVTEGLYAYFLHQRSDMFAPNLNSIQFDVTKIAATKLVVMNLPRYIFECSNR